MAYSVRNGGTDYSAVEILDIGHRNVLPGTLEEGFCRGLVFAPDGSGFHYFNRKVRDPRPHYQATYWHRFGDHRSLDREVFFAGEKHNLFLGIRLMPTSWLMLLLPQGNNAARPFFYIGHGPTRHQ